MDCCKQHAFQCQQERATALAGKKEEGAPVLLLQFKFCL